MTRTVAFAALLSLTITTPALAEPHVWQTGDGFTVRATGLDLSTTDGRAALLRRVDAAAVRLCRPVSLRGKRRSCAEDARAQVMASAPARLGQSIRTALAERNAVRLATR